MSFTIQTRRDDRERIIANLQQKQIRFVSEGGTVIQSEARVRCPVMFGQLRRSILVDVGRDEETFYSETAPNTEYAILVEYGIGQRAQPYMEPGYQAAKPKIDILASRLKP